MRVVHTSAIASVPEVLEGQRTAGGALCRLAERRSAAEAALHRRVAAQVDTRRARPRIGQSQTDPYSGKENTNDNDL